MLMKRFVRVLLVTLLVVGFGAASVATAHPGGTDSNGGHKCHTNCSKWGLKNGEYHYHNGGGSSAPAPKPAPTPAPAPKPAPLPTADVYINGALLKVDQKAVIKDSTTLVPMRAIFEALGATVQWDDQTKKIVGTKGTQKITLTVGNKVAYTSAGAIQLSQPAQIVNKRTLVPLRFIAETLGANVQWDKDTRTVKITN
ncbi:copper amine oxidase N-terminal domain-containing protein [Paenalkalicoccus suaedae]|uniref:Copper amine oxidase N-terminal domain-containing protein n=1 Tax=Paenalkalicoccus suaedae TaxID=2592382 RepID=A0A859FAP9_9BACI|nr:copper amine oxidase N-terminal domain-containing protein [Paenalkalicoccus suaedae]QKS70329.1 copper amine oxidase N-terminal domain-containing protein [Paenalkalicoccus suaedae]